MTAPLFEDERTIRERADGVSIIARRAFAAEYFDYKPGEHVVFGGPTTRGKTTLAFDLLEYIVSSSFPAYVAVSKPADPVTSSRGRALGFRRVADWPPQTKVSEVKWLGGSPPPGYLVWPHFGNLEKDMERCSVVLAKLLNDRYTAGTKAKSQGGILVMDDTMIKAKIQGLDNHMTTILAMAGAMNLGEWIFVQKPTDSGRTTLWGYENSTHQFFTKGGDTRMLRRYSEIIGDHGELARSIIPTLGPYQFLYVHKVEGFICVVDAK